MEERLRSAWDIPRTHLQGDPGFRQCHDSDVSDGTGVSCCLDKCLLRSAHRALRMYQVVSLGGDSHVDLPSPS